MEKPASPIYTLMGVITSRKNEPLEGLAVRAFNADPRAPKTPLGPEALTDAQGRYALQFRRPGPYSGQTEAGTLRVTIGVYKGEKLLGTSEPQRVGQERLVINLQVNYVRPDPNEPWFRVYGWVRSEYGDLLNGVTVRAFDRDLRSEQLLGSAVTQEGHYGIRYKKSQFIRAEKDTADLVLKVLDANDTELYQTPVRFNAPVEVEIDIVLQGATYTGPSEWEAVTADLLPLLEDLAPSALREDDQHQDITFLAGETGRPALTLCAWVAAHLLAEKTRREETALPPEVFFGFLRLSQPALLYDTFVQGTQNPDNLALLEDKLLRGVADLGPDLQQALLNKALAQNLIPARLGPQIKTFIDILRAIALRYTGQTTFGGGKGTVSQLLQLTPLAPAAQTAFTAAFADHTGPLNTFWQKLVDDKVLPADVMPQVKLTFELGALTRNHIPLVGVLVTQFQSGALKAKRDLATYDRAQWVALFKSPGPDGTPIGVPANIDGATPEARLEQFAAILDQQFERAYPTTSFAAKLSRAPQSPVQAKGDVVRFINNNPAFHLDRYRVEHYLADNPDALQGIEDKTGLVTTLKSVQRVFKLSPTFSAADALLTRKIDSAQQIYFMGQSQFLRSLTESSINKLDAKMIYRKAANAYALALTLFSDYNRAMNGTPPYGVPNHTPDPTTQAKIAALPNLQTLFGSLDYCECAQCRSVYSAAAYFVDVMRFLGERQTDASATKTVQQVLLERRPDLGEIELSCENTDTPLPYIDLVNEILEDVVAPPTPVTLNSAIEPDLVAGPIKPSVIAALAAQQVPAGADAQVFAPDSRGQWAVRDAQHAYKLFKTGPALQLLPTRQTFLSAAELRANPEYTNPGAYDKLAGEVFPLNLPFDLWRAQVTAYLNHLGLPYPRLLELFQQKALDDVTLSPTDQQIDGAWLGLTETERQILTGTLPGKQDWDFWGLAQNGNNIPDPENPADPTKNTTGGWIDVLSHVPILLNRSGLTYQELLQLLDMPYVNAAGSISVDDTADPNAASCDTSTFTLRNLTQDALNRMHRFIRLWRKLGSAMWELDLLLPDMNPDPNVVDKRITDAALRAISQMNRLRDPLGADWRVVASLYSGIDHALYVDRTQEGMPAVQTLYQRLFRNKLVDAAGSFPASPDLIAGTIAGKIPAILAAFRIKEADLTLILTDLSLSPTDNLDVVILSHIYRITVLAKGLDLTLDAFLRLKRLWAQDPFADPAATLRFIKLAQQVAASEFSVFELDYLLTHHFTANSGVALEDKTILTILQALRDGLRKLSDGLRLKTEETKPAYVKSKLGLLPVLSKDADQAVALALIDGTWQGAPAARNTLIDMFFAGVLDLNVAKVNLAALPGGLSPADRQVQVDARYDYVQPALQAFLLQAAKEAFVRQKTAEMLQLDVPSAGALLAGLSQPGGAANLLSDLDDSRLLDLLPDGTYQRDLNETNFPLIYKALRLLHKDALVITKLRMKGAEVAWWLTGTQAADLGWMHPQDFPIDTTKTVALGRWVAIEQFFEWKGALPKSDQTALEFASKVLDNTTTSAANIGDLASLTAWDAGEITALATAFHWLAAAPPFDVVKAQLRQPANLARLADCRQALHRLGVDAARAIGWATAAPSSLDADSLKQTVKAKYDLPQWEQVIQPLQDDFRDQKRQALVTWLVTHPDQARGQAWSDANGLYNFFLIDVEMSACMLTSRLKQAAASAQLFVQRCLLNLEPGIIAKTDPADPAADLKWNQWKWMKHYRTWEANRKVFLYPENWIEPELRDEKSPFFKELEDELNQNDVTNDTVEQAYLNYLEKLDKVANLEIRAMFNQVITSDQSILHVFGRSRSSQSPEHYYRQRINGGRWKAWEKVELDINANHLVAGMHNRRLYLLWPQFLEKAHEPTNLTTPNANQSITVAPPNKYWEVRLYWSELKKNKWTPKVLSDSFVEVNQSSTGGNNPQRVQFKTRLVPAVVAKVFTPYDLTNELPFSYGGFEKIGRQVAYIHRGLNGSDWFRVWGYNFEYLMAPPNANFSNGLLVQEAAPLYFNANISAETAYLPSGLSRSANAQSYLLLNQAELGAYQAVDAQAGGALSSGTFSVWDSRHTYFVDFAINTTTYYVGRTPYTRTTTDFQFFIHYHPFVELFIKELNVWGLRGLLNRQIQVDPASLPGSPQPFNFADYAPTWRVRQNYQRPDKSYTYPTEDVDFTYLGGYAPYNWELFFHAPFFIANKLAANQRFEEALAWYHYIFNPTNTDTATPDPATPQQKFWITKPFYETTKADYYQQKIENIMLAIAKGDLELRKQVEEWRDQPYSPHLIARMRTVAYQKAVLIKYIETLIAWGDQVFRQDTLEALNEATQLYVLAASVLGPRPKSIPKKVPNPVQTFYQLQQAGIDDFGNVLKEVENLLPPVSSGSTQGEDSPDLPRLDVLYFCIPNNDQLLSLWDTVADRLFKIRHCMNIEGVVRQLPLFEPPIDPALLVKAAAAGLDIGEALSDLNASLPVYRFGVMLQRALELTNEVRSLGGAMLAALEKRDAEGFALLRASHERMLLDLVRRVRASQVDEAGLAGEALAESRHVVEARRDHQQQLISQGWNDWEKAWLGLTIGAITLESAGVGLEAIGASMALIPDLDAGAAGFGASPTVKIKIGGKNISISVTGAANALKGLASIAQMSAGMTSTIGSYMRRAEEWDFQLQLAEKELPQIDKQIAAAQIRQQIAIQELANQDKQIDNAQQEDEYQRGKFTNQELYDWLVSQLSTVYFQSYQLAYDLAKRAERCFRYELGLTDSSYIQFGYWDSLKKGLLSGDRLYYDLKRLEAAYYEQNRREYELTKHVSLAQLDPIALLKLQQNGECFVDLPETIFDMDYPGHYFRRLKTVGLSIPCVAGPYTTIACTLTLVSNHLRKDATLLANKYERDQASADPRFRDEIAAIQSIATSTAQNDRGLFDLNFRDERYLPFEGAGAISSWHIQLNKDLPQFDFSTISDVILHVNYTAREGGDFLRAKAAAEFNKKLNALAEAENRRGLYRVFDLKREYPDKWYRFFHPANPADDQSFVLDDLADRLPYFTRGYTTKKVRQIELAAQFKDGATYKARLSPLGNTPADLLALAPDPTYTGLHRAFKDLTGSEIDLGAWTLSVQLDGAADFKSLPADAIQELFLIINYTLA